MQDPRKRYPGPPFVTKHQEPPGLASAMTPKPDQCTRSVDGADGPPGPAGRVRTDCALLAWRDGSYITGDVYRATGGNGLV